MRKLQPPTARQRRCRHDWLCYATRRGTDSVYKVRYYRCLACHWRRKTEEQWVSWEG